MLCSLTKQEKSYFILISPILQMASCNFHSAESKIITNRLSDYSCSDCELYEKFIKWKDTSRGN